MAVSTGIISACRGTGECGRGAVARGLAVVCLALLLLPALPARAGLFNPQMHTLANGLQIVVIADHRAPVVSHMLYFRVGAADEAAGESGIAHFLEHLMFKGTPTVPSGEFSRIVARNGGRENAFTSQDKTAYFQNVASDRLELVMRLEADRMVNLQLGAEDVATEREVILEERRSRVDNNPGSQLGEMIRATQFLNHPYGTPVIGWEHEIRTLSREDAVAFYRRYYAPNNAILLVAGDVTLDQVVALAEKYYGVIPARELPPRVRPQEPPQLAPRRVELTDPRVAQPSLQRSYLAPSRHSPGNEHAIPLSILAEVLGGSTISRFYQELVVRQKIAVSAGAYYDAVNLDNSTFGFYATPAAGHSLRELEQAIDQLIAKVLKEGLSAEEVEREKASKVASAVYARDSVFAAPRILGDALTSGLTVEDVESWPELVAAVTPEQVMAAARLVLDPRRSVTGYLMPES